MFKSKYNSIKTLKTSVYTLSICHNCYEKHVKPELDKFPEA